MSAPHEDDWAPQPPDDALYSPDAPDTQDALGEFLRERFHQAVSGLEPGPGTLDYLRRAVPARRRRRNAALAATAVSVFAVSAGVTLAARSSFESGPSQAHGTTIGNLMTTATDDAPGGGSGHGPGTPGGRDMSSGGAVGGGQEPSSQAQTSGSAKPPLSTTALSATVTGSPQAPMCQNSSVTSVVAVQNGTSGGVTYETFQGTAKAVCTLQGMPGLTVTGAGGAPARVLVYRADRTIAPQLPDVSAAGQALVLQPGERFEFQLAWVPVVCPTSPPATPPTSVPTSGSPAQTATSAGPTPTGPNTPSSSQPTPSGTPSSSVPATSVYSVVYSVFGSQPAQSASFRADCGAAVYVTDYFAAPGQRQPTAPVTSAVTGH